MRSRTLAGLGFAAAVLLAACGQAASGSHGAAPGSSATSESGGVHVGHASIGDVLVNSAGHTLYGFTNDMNGTSSCQGPCAQTWPPLEVGSAWTAGPQVTTAKLHTSLRTDGHFQLAAGKWPLYAFSGDSRPGDVNGEGLLGKWFAVRTDGTLLKTSSVPATPPTTASSGVGYGY